MKLYGILTAAAIILPAFASCNKEISESGPVDKIRLEPISLSTSDTKTSVNGNEIWWTLTDQIAIFSNIGNYLTPYTLSATSVEGSNAVFAGEVGEGTTDFYAIYPYSLATGAAGGFIDITVPVDQTAKAGSFGEGMNISIAKGTKKPGIPQVAGVAFHNVCSYLKFTVPSYISNVNRVDVTCDRNIAGSTTVNYANLESGSGTVTGPGTSSTVSMSGPFASGSTFWFVLTPGKVNSLTIKLSTEDGENWTRTSSKSFTLNIGQPKNLGIIDFVPTLQASAEHTKDNKGILTGTKVEVDLGLPDALMPAVTNVSLKVSKEDGTVVREYTSNGVSSKSITIPANSSWPYLPQGKYTVSGTYKTGERTVPFVSKEFTPRAPEFSVNTPSAHTNYDTYLKFGATAANAENGSTIYIEQKNIVTISSDILTKYASLASGYSYTIDGNTAKEGKNTVQSWKAYDVVAKFTFDGVEKASDALTCHVTGLPYTLQPTKSDWKATGTTSYVYFNNGYIQIKGNAINTTVTPHPSIQSKSFHIPSDINVITNFKYDISSVSVKPFIGPTRNYWSTLFLYIGGTEVMNHCKNSNGLEQISNKTLYGYLSTSNPYIKFEGKTEISSWDNAYSNIYQVEIKYSENK